MGRSSSIDYLTSQIGVGSRSYDLGGASMMIFLISSVVGKENEDSTEVQQLVVSTFLSSFVQPELADNSQQVLLIF